MDQFTSSTETKLNTKENTLRRFRLVVICVLLSALTFALYWQVIHFEFINFDDLIYVVENKHVHNGLSFESILWAFHFSKAGDVSYWHPITWLSHMVDYQLFGLKAGMHHLSNVIYHVLNTILLFITLWLFTRATWKSLFVAILFAIHPINVDSVAWIAERKNLLSTSFWMLTLLLYYYYTRKPDLNRYLLVLLTFILGLLSKPMLVTLPFVLLLLDFWPLNRISSKGDIIDDPKSVFNKNNLNLVLEKLPLMILSVALIIYNSRVMSYIGAFVSEKTVPTDLRFKNAIISYVLYIQKMFWPVNLTFYYPFPKEIPMWEVVGSLTFIVIVTAIALRYMKKFPYIIFGWLWFIGTLIPVSGIMQGGLWPQIAERWAYIPFIGLFIIISWGVPDILKSLQKKEIFISIAASIIILSLAVKTSEQLEYWKDNFALFGHAIEMNNNNVIAYNNLGVALGNKGDMDGATRHFRQALHIDPLYSYAYYNLGVVLSHNNQVTAAIENFAKAIQLNPYNPLVHYNMGLMLLRVRKIDDAMKHFNEALRLDPSNADAHYELGTYFEAKGKLDEAIKHFNEALKVDPNHAGSHRELGKIYAGMDKNDEAIKHFNEALRINPKNADAHYYLGLDLIAMGKNDEAMKHFNEALRIDPKNANAHCGLGTILAGMGKVDEAEKEFNEALKINPKDVIAYSGLGTISVRKGKNDEAMKNFNEALKIEPNNASTHYVLGTVLAATGKKDEAEKHFNEALRINPSTIEAHIGLGDLVFHKGNYDEAIRHYTEALKINPHQPIVYNSLGTAFIYKGDIKKAIKNYQESIQEKPDYASAINNLNNARINQKKLEDWVAMIQQSLKSDPQNPALHTKLGDIYRQLGEYDEAIGQYQKAISIKPDFTQAMYGLVLVYSHKQEYTKALEVLQNIRKIKPGNPEVYYNIACIYAKQNMTDESIAWLKQSIQKGFHNWDMINKDPDLASIRNTSYVSKLMMSHPSPK